MSHENNRGRVTEFYHNIIVWDSIIQGLCLRQDSKTVLLRQVFNSEIFIFFSVVEHMIQKNQCLFTNTQCKVCCALLISESQKLAHYQVSHCTLELLYSPDPVLSPLLPGLHSEV